MKYEGVMQKYMKYEEVMQELCAKFVEEHVARSMCVCACVCVCVAKQYVNYAKCWQNCM
jgi:hypothetical protein